MSFRRSKTFGISFDDKTPNYVNILARAHGLEGLQTSESRQQVGL